MLMLAASRHHESAYSNHRFLAPNSAGFPGAEAGKKTILG